MAWSSRVIHFVRRLLQRGRVEQELDDEVRDYYEQLAERGVATGLSRGEAMRAAHLQFDRPEQVQQSVRENRMGASFETLWQDIRYALRMLVKSPGFTVFAVLTIALALGANAAIFTLVDGVLLKSAAYPHAERIVQLWEKPPGSDRNAISGANYLDWARQAQSFEAIAAQTWGSVTYTGGREPKSLPAGLVTARYFDVFGIKPALGRTFARDEDQPGKDKVVVLTYRVWSSLFGADPTLVGRTINLNGQAHTVIGVLPGSSEFDRNSNDVWVPLVFAANPARDYHYLFSVARLKPGVSLEQAQSEMRAIGHGIAEAYPNIKKGWSVTVDRYIDRLIGRDLRTSLTILMWAVALVLLIGCANLANLLLARATLRAREIALRTALGAGRGRIARMLLTESLMLSIAGALLGIALGYGLLRWIQMLLPPYYFPAESNITMDGRVLLFLAIVTILTSIAFGLAPALQASRRDSAEALREGGRSNSAGRGRLIARHVFVAAQVGAAFILLVGSGLLIRSFQRVLSVDTGFRVEGLVAGNLPVPMEKNPDAGALVRYNDRILEEVLAVPGVGDAAIASALPLRGWGDGMPFRLASKPDERVGSGFKIVTPGYFHALGLPRRAGRYLDQRDVAGMPFVVVVNESFVKRYFPQESPLGKRILVERILPTRRGLGPDTAWEIVGVVADEKADGLEESEDIGTYASFAQNPVVGLGLVVRGSGEAGVLIKSVERAMWRVNKDQVFDHAQAVAQMKAESLMSRRLTTSLLSGFALLALLLACGGIYGVLSFVTAGRTQEMGIRAAMGASRGRLIWLVIQGGSVPVLIGIVVGLGGAMWLTRFMRSMLFAVQPIDVPTLVGVCLLFATVALIACLVPAWRAASGDPVSALRQA